MTPEPRQRIGLLVRVDSVTSEVAHRFPGGLPDPVIRDLLAVSNECRALADRDELAAAVAERWWPNRHLGDLTDADWRKVYKALEPRS
jgi:hypothetical protein